MEGLVIDGLIIHDFPLLTVVLQLKFEGVLSLVLIFPAAPTSIGFNIGLVIPFAVRLPEVGLSIFGPGVTVSNKMVHSSNDPTTTSVKILNIFIRFQFVFI